MVEWMRGLVHSFGPQGMVMSESRRGVSLHTAAKMINVLFLSRVVSDSKRLRSVIHHAVGVVFPALAKHLNASDVFNTSMVLSGSTISRARVLVDCAYTLLERREETRSIRFGLADSSPQKGFDFLLSMYDEILVADVVPLARAVNTLIQYTNSVIQEGEVESDGEGVVHDEPVIFEAHQRLRKSIARRHSSLPAQRLGVRGQWCLSQMQFLAHGLGHWEAFRLQTAWIGNWMSFELLSWVIAATWELS